MRPRRRRRIGWIPQRNYFTPDGEKSPENEVNLTLDELEALRLADLEGIYHEEAAKIMNISRATFGRILEEARKKVADSIINGRPLRIQGGVVEFKNNLSAQQDFCVCRNCGFRKPHTLGVPCRTEKCPVCGSQLTRLS